MTVLDGVDLTVPGRTTPDRTTSERMSSSRATSDRAASDRSVAERVALARAVLARAELRTGARSTLPVSGSGSGRLGGESRLGGEPHSGGGARSGEPHVGADDRHDPAAGSRRAAPSAAPPAATRPAVPAGALARPAVPAGPVEVSAPAPSAPTAPVAGSSLTRPDRLPLPVHPELAGLLPEGALRRGASLVVTGSTSLVLALVARASQEGSWVAVVGLPAVGLLAAQQAGVVLDRLALVPRPGPDAPTVLAALLDGVDLVVVGDDAALVESDRRRLTARARERGTVLLSTASWPGAHVVLTAEPVEWTGLGAGHGHLHRHRLAVTRAGRGSAGRGIRAEVVLPVRGDRVDAVPTRSTTTTRRADASPAPLRMVG